MVHFNTFIENCDNLTQKSGSQLRTGWPGPVERTQVLSGGENTPARICQWQIYGFKMEQWKENVEMHKSLHDTSHRHILFWPLVSEAWQMWFIYGTLLLLKHPLVSYSAFKSTFSCCLSMNLRAFIMLSLCKDQLDFKKAPKLEILLTFIQTIVVTVQ